MTNNMTPRTMKMINLTIVIVMTVFVIFSDQNLCEKVLVHSVFLRPVVGWEWVSPAHDLISEII